MAKKEERKKILRLRIILIILLIIIFFIFYLMRLKIGKIGYEDVNAESIKITKVTQDGSSWEDIEDLNIFTNPEFENEKIIAPMSKSEYKFKIENTLDDTIQYNIRFIENNSLNVNIKYRLKLDNYYIIGNEDVWEDVENLKLEDIILTKNSSNIYTLEWFWEEANNDTEIGKKVYVDYKLKIDIDSEVYIEK